MKRKLAILGATGSIGRAALDVVRANDGDFELALLSAHSKGAALEALGAEFPRALLALSGAAASAGPGSSGPGPDGSRVGYRGPEALLAAIAEAGADITLNGIAGAAGLLPSLAALRAGSALALANKETVVLAYPLVKALAEEQGLPIIPVDSEHAAVFRLLEAHGRDQVREVILTASGGPFRGHTLHQLKKVTVREALAHPTWNMGPKISVDSATMANKGLEVIEAVRLFDLKPEQVTVVIHPQSVVHSLVRLVDGALYAQLSRPDMRLPIQEALYWPETVPSPFGGLELPGLRLDFEAPDGERFPMLPLAYEAARLGALYPCAYNGANEAAVEAFFHGRLGFLDIPAVVQYVLNQDWGGELHIESITEADRRSRELAAFRIGG
ncbi:MAG: 1-deoxy-D-xylulose-5-phosphate reductoisomerase [Treponema sp.]|jgi:1-deoxy-D-xylulose-5-phosphate reductoisomerase|nr:1-deoxy-D-xylulose-5-phosphate reductoisomerase [Treponema sp.]